MKVLERIQLTSGKDKRIFLGDVEKLTLLLNRIYGWKSLEQNGNV